MDISRSSGKFRVLMVIIVLSCGAVFAAEPRIKMATTTSTDNSGLLEYLLPKFKAVSGISVDVIAVGTGKALKLGENGDVDVVFVHARSAENKFVEAGHGTNRHDVMYNDFIIVGAKKDVAGLKKADSVIKAFGALGKGKATFVSRGDDSGTHKKEKQLWKTASLKPAGEWYLETGQGMGASLMVADEKRGYCLVDRGTYIAFEDKVDLEIRYEGGDELKNEYGIIAVNPARHKGISYARAMKLINWITSAAGQSAIGEFRVKGQQLFYPVTPVKTGKVKGKHGV